MTTPTVATLNEIAAAIAAQLESELAGVIDGIQIDPQRVFNPTPPCIDIYPGNPFLAQSAFGQYEALFAVRARVSMADNQAGQELLLDLLDPRSPMSVRAALRADPTFAGTVDDSGLEDGNLDAGGFTIYQDTAQSEPLLGCEWPLRVVLR
jgi:hypothetical protein